MTPGLGFFYSGLLRRKNALSMIFLSLAVYAIVSFQWFFWGYSLSFSPSANVFIGTLDRFGFMEVDLQPSLGSPKIPALAFAVYQMMFATITPMIILGAIAERGRIAPALIFTFIWTTIVYDPIACWTWNPNGWSFKLGSLDFAGGGPVHMSSGTAALAYSILLGKRRGYGTEKLAYKPHNVSHVVLGTALIWFGWFGFNGGSALAANLKAFQAIMVTNTAASVGGITWLVLDYFQEQKWSPVGFCSGAIAGLVGITPASGYVGAPSAVAIGFLTAIACNYATKLKILLGCDDALDIFASHGVGGFAGSILTAVFADKRVAGFDGFTEIEGGWINHNYKQIAYQLASSCAIMGYSFVVTVVILVALNAVPTLRLRASSEAEIIGVDEHDLGECAYDYAFLERDLENMDYHDELRSLSKDHSTDQGATNQHKQYSPSSTQRNEAERPNYVAGNERDISKVQ
ncbi:ammonium transporter AmtB-like domain-containing protein [Phakopsora pachyrhizi]|uniref:Ammonium transporter n=2 Tax=Phakopsora pachyrhizi TaxID=170000 RepID=A0AAV0AG26_PHAPC|nr:ammonium transporter AmtB-like domain-containing protein [Phakopsora pachyrhizi]